MQPELKPIPTNDQILGSGGPRYAPGAALPGVSAQKVLRNTYLLLALTMVPTVIGAYIGIATAGVIRMPAFAISARPAPLPPSRSFMVPVPSALPLPKK